MTPTHRVVPTIASAAFPYTTHVISLKSIIERGEPLTPLSISSAPTSLHILLSLATAPRLPVFVTVEELTPCKIQSIKTQQRRPKLIPLMLKDCKSRLNVSAYGSYIYFIPKSFAYLYFSRRFIPLTAWDKKQ